MPVSISKTKGGKYRVKTPGGVKAKGTTKAKAIKQKRLLNAVEHGWKPTGKPKRPGEFIEKMNARDEKRRIAESAKRAKARKEAEMERSEKSVAKAAVKSKGVPKSVKKEAKKIIKSH